MTSSPTRSSSTVTAVVVLAAGAGTRMRSSKPKMLHAIAGRPLIWHALTAAAGVGPQHVVAVLGHGRDEVTSFLDAATDLPAVTIAVQDEQLGTGHATACGLASLTGPLTGTIIVSYGDTPLLRAETLTTLAETHRQQGNAVTVLTADVPDPTGYGRIVRDQSGAVLGIVEQKDADADQRAITEINSGVYAFDGAVLAEALPRVGKSNAQGEQYLTDVVGLARADGLTVGTVGANDAVETEGVNDRVQLAQLARVLNDRIIRGHQRSGVTFLDPATTWVHADVTICADTEIGPGTLLQAGSRIGAGVSIGPDSTVSNCVVRDGATIVRAHCLDSEIGENASVGPYAYLRQHVVLGAGAKVGTFVELKASTLGAGAKVPHQAYLGDATVGPRSNVGAGVITANYDGKDKFPTTIGADAFVGSNATLVAPVDVADGAYVATGSTVTDDIPAGALGVARGRQYNSADWVLRRHPGSKMDTSARSAGAGAASASVTDAPPTGKKAASSVQAGSDDETASA